MRLVLLIFGSSAALAAAASAGTITGSVRAHGKEGADSGASGGKYDSREFKFVERVNYEEMKDFIVYIDGPFTDKTPIAPQTTQIVTRRVEQKKATFAPHVLPVLVGTTVEWPNNDTILHNVFSFSETKPFDLGLYKSPYTGKVPSVTFDKPGKVDVFCSIHSRMNCIVLVLENPHFAATDSQGNYSITNVPPGTYKLKAWHERLPPQTKEIFVPESGEVKANFVMGITNLPKP
jgi:plastocyanin